MTNIWICYEVDLYLLNEAMCYCLANSWKSYYRFFYELCYCSDFDELLT